jgi:U1 zinc finger
MYWCDYCKVWMNDNPNARATHEKGIRHKENVEKSEPLLWLWAGFTVV